MTTIKEVAQRANVSISTVSRVYCQRVHVDTETRDRVLKAAKELNYQPNMLAKSLKEGRSQTIALVVPNIENAIWPIVANGIEEEARKNGFIVMLCNTDDNAEAEMNYIRKLRTRWIDGIILAPANENRVRELYSGGFPLVTILRGIEGEVNSVMLDNFHAAYNATKYLLTTGHKNIAIASGRQEINIYRKRLEGYKAALADNGIAVNDNLILQETHNEHSFYSLTENLLKSGIKLDAILATSDPKAIMVMRAIKDFGYKIPDEISVMGIDNISISSLVEPPLTTMSQPLYKMGVMAAKKFNSPN